VSERQDEQPGPVGRLWDVAGDRLSAPGVAEAFCAEIEPLVGTAAGNRGRLVLVHRRRGLMRLVSVTDDATSWLTPTSMLDALTGALQAVSWSTLHGPLPFAVVRGRFLSASPGSIEGEELGRLRARLLVAEGGGAAAPATVAAVHQLLDRLVEDVPGAVAAFTMTDVGRDSVLALSVWSDEPSADRAAELEGELVARMALDGTVADVGTYELLMCDEPERPGHRSTCPPSRDGGTSCPSPPGRSEG